MRIIGATSCRFLYGRRVVSSPRDEAHRLYTQMFRQKAIAGEDGRELTVGMSVEITFHKPTSRYLSDEVAGSDLALMIPGNLIRDPGSETAWVALPVSCFVGFGKRSRE